MPVALLAETKVGAVLKRYVASCCGAGTAKSGPPCGGGADGAAARALLAAWKDRARREIVEGKAEEDALVAGLEGCATWRQLFDLLKRCNRLKMQKFAARAKQMYEADKRAKRTTRPTDLRDARRKRARQTAQISPPALSPPPPRSLGRVSRVSLPSAAAPPKHRRPPARADR